MLGKGTFATVVLGLSGLLTPTRALADPSPSAEADVLFEEARDAMARRDYVSACPKLERSEALDPGIGTEFNLARCYELAGRLASAWSTYQAVRVETHAAGQTDREEVARKLASALEPRLARVLIHLPEGASPPGLELRSDGVIIDRTRWDAPIPVDPGPHTVEASAPSATSFKTTFVVEREAQLVTIDLPPLATKVIFAPVPSPPSFRDQPTTGVVSSFGARKGLALALTGLAAVGASIGTFYGVKAISRESQASPFCDTGGCDPTGFGLRSDARWAGNASTVSFSIGAALALAAGILWFHCAHQPQADGMERQHALSVPVGTTLAGKYRVEGLLGSGGMGIVLAATHLHLRERVAIKLLRPEAAVRSTAVERFLREARVAMKLRGEHVVRIFDVGQLDDGAPFIAMECLEGEDFGAMLREQGPIAPEVAAHYVVQACEGVAEAHAHGVIHRDLKPANLFLATRLDGSPCVKVLDFGASKILVPDPRLVDSFSAVTADASDAHLRIDASRLGFADTVEAVVVGGLTRAGALVGSPRYMAPEQVRASHEVDARADVWALGAILYELLGGHPAFEGNTLEQLRKHVLDGNPLPLEGVSPALAGIIRRCLAKDPQDRYPTAAALAKALLNSGAARRRTSRTWIAIGVAFATIGIATVGVGLRSPTLGGHSTSKEVPAATASAAAVSTEMPATEPSSVTLVAALSIQAPPPRPPVAKPARVRTEVLPAVPDPLQLDAGTLFSTRK